MEPHPIVQACRDCQIYTKVDPRGTLWHIKHESGLCAWFYSPDDPPEPYCFTIGWYLATDCSRRLSMSFSNVMRGAQRRAIWRCFGQQPVLSMLTHGLRCATDGTAFEPDHRSLINSNP